MGQRIKAYILLHGMEGFDNFFKKRIFFFFLNLSSLHFPELDIGAWLYDLVTCRKIQTVSGLFAGLLKFSGRNVNEGRERR